MYFVLGWVGELDLREPVGGDPDPGDDDNAGTEEEMWKR